MRIVIDARESGTSTGRYVDKLIEYMQLLNPKYEFIVLTKKHRVEFFKELNKKLRVEESSYKEFTFAEQLALMMQVRRLKPDLVHFSMVQQPILYMGKTVTTMHDLTTTRFDNPSKNRLVFTFKQFVYKWVNRWVAVKSNVIITPTEYVKEDVAKFARINSRKIIVTLESADNIADSAVPLVELENSRFIMYVGRPLPHKNLYRLVAAFSQLNKTQPDLKLVLVGKKDSLYDDLEDWANDQSIPNIVFTDFVSEGQLRWLYENCQAYIFPSLSEGFGLPGLEAMRHGAPVVCSNATCLPEIYDNAAHYFDPLDVEDMRDKIAEVLSNKKLRANLIRKGKAQVGKYSWRRMAQQTLDIYDSVLGESSQK